jgi:hypothetical protein
MDDPHDDALGDKGTPSGTIIIISAGVALESSIFLHPTDGVFSLLSG